jgi:hypothetical protein
VFTKKKVWQEEMETLGEMERGMSIDVECEKGKKSPMQQLTKLFTINIFSQLCVLYI